MDSISAQHLTFSPYSFTKSRYIIVTCVHTYSKYNVCTGETRKISRGIREKLVLKWAMRMMLWSGVTALVGPIIIPGNPHRFLILSCFSLD